MNNPRDWSAGLWLIVRQTVIITGCLLLATATCAVLWRAFITG